MESNLVNAVVVDVERTQMEVTMMMMATERKRRTLMYQGLHIAYYQV